MIQYSFINIIRNAFSLVYTKVAFPKARIIRWPLYITGSGFNYGKGLTMGRGCHIDTNSKSKSLIIGKNVQIGDCVHINANYKVEVGDNVLMESKILISDTTRGKYYGDNQSLSTTSPSEREICFKEVLIGNNVMIGENVVILPGTIIGDGCIIEANAVLNGRKYPQNTIIAGIPAKVTKHYSQQTKEWDKF